MHRHTLSLRKSCNKPTSNRGHVAHIDTFIKIYRLFSTLFKPAIAVSTSLSPPIYCHITSHATEVGTRIFTAEHFVTSPPCPLAEILQHILSLRTIEHNAQRKAIECVTKPRNKIYILSFLVYHQFASIFCLYNEQPTHFATSQHHFFRILLHINKDTKKIAPAEADAILYL